MNVATKEGVIYQQPLTDLPVASEEPEESQQDTRVMKYFPSEYASAEETRFSILSHGEAKVIGSDPDVENVSSDNYLFSDVDIAALLFAENYEVLQGEGNILYIPGNIFQWINKYSPALERQNSSVEDDFWSIRYNYYQIDPESEIGQRLKEKYKEGYAIVPITPNGKGYEGIYVKDSSGGSIRCVVLVKKKTGDSPSK